MISPALFCRILEEEGIGFFTGVPDSLLKEFCAYVEETRPTGKHLIAVNEGTAIGLASGFHLATGDMPLVYLQNSGLGNAINPLLSLADPEVYGLPMVVLIGWRGAPGVRDEPQHVKQGRVCSSMLDAMEMPYSVVDANTAIGGAQWAARKARSDSRPVGLLVNRDVFSKYESGRNPNHFDPQSISRECAISIVIDSIRPDSTVVATTGMISRELYEKRVANGQSHASDFLSVGSMGHASQIAYGIALGRPDREIVCLDGDGSILMHMGGLATIGATGEGNILHVVLNNGVHDSVGGQPTVARNIELTEIARACGYHVVSGPHRAADDIRAATKRLSAVQGCRFLEIHVGTGARPNLMRPKESPAENKMNFIDRFRD